LLVQVGLLAPVSTDPSGPAGFGVSHAASTSERSMVPTLQGRVAFSTEMSGTDKLIVGAAGHFGMEEFAVTMIDPITMMPVPTGATQSAVSWAGVLDFVVPIAGMITIQGEAFYGANLDGFFSSVNVTGSPDFEPVVALGGWAQVLFKLDSLTLGAAAGIEMPQPDPEPAGGGPSNMAIYGSATWAFAPTFKVGLEFNHIRTDPGGMMPTLSGSQLSLSSHFSF
jgi:hypothetical protein